MELKKFIDLYCAACKKTVKTEEPVILASRKMKAYSRNHQLQPLEESTDMTVKNTYSCTYNGKEIKIDISLFRPEEDVEG